MWQIIYIHCTCKFSACVKVWKYTKNSLTILVRGSGRRIKDRKIVKLATPFSNVRKETRKTFSTFSELEIHLDVGKHYDREDDRNMHDRLRQDWAAKFSSIDQTKTKPVAGNRDNNKARTNKSDCRMGWALQKMRPKAHITTSAKQYLKEMFDIGERIGEKAEPNQVALDMRTARNESDERQFQREEWLTSTQIKGFFFTPFCWKKTASSRFQCRHHFCRVWVERVAGT